MDLTVQKVTAGTAPWHVQARTYLLDQQLYGHLRNLLDQYHLSLCRGYIQKYEL
jgi:hypothetical protein